MGIGQPCSLALLLGSLLPHLFLQPAVTLPPWSELKTWKRWPWLPVSWIRSQGIGNRQALRTSSCFPFAGETGWKLLEQKR